MWTGLNAALRGEARVYWCIVIVCHLYAKGVVLCTGRRCQLQLLANCGIDGNCKASMIAWLENGS
jgi:hypothetical protein